MKSMRIAAALAGFLAAIIAVPQAARADDYPSRAIRIIVPFPPGGLNDNVARIVQPYLSQKLGQPVVVENKSGASGIIGTDAVAKAAPDGYTLAVVASSKVQAKTLKDFVALAKTQPGKLTYATPGTDSQSHFVTELFDSRAGIKMVQVPYRGGAPSILSLISGETDFGVLSTQLSGPQIKAGKLVALASGGDARSPHFPDVPTLAESGYANFEALQWVGMLAPAKTPKDVISKLNGALRDILAMPEVKARFDAQGNHGRYKHARGIPEPDLVRDQAVERRRRCERHQGALTV